MLASVIEESSFTLSSPQALAPEDVYPVRPTTSPCASQSPGASRIPARSRVPERARPGMLPAVVIPPFRQTPWVPEGRREGHGSMLELWRSNFPLMSSAL